jgi:hypothetical protein
MRAEPDYAIVGMAIPLTGREISDKTSQFRDGRRQRNLRAAGLAASGYFASGSGRT